MKDKGPLWKKWWFWLIIGVVCINILITNLNENNYTPEQDHNELKQGNISTH
ncbi:hypothetical protein [Alkalihalobacterium elongatum]|uniref:hypothetical protein n=1 Tax=Alkalihalobacterium elongatum TaxID=2675466 RepID=UPI001C1FA4FD|nr:hypothetical protein [Alkalihalobacterium elongatum]